MIRCVQLGSDKNWNNSKTEISVQQQPQQCFLGALLARCFIIARGYDEIIRARRDGGQKSASRARFYSLYIPVCRRDTTLLRRLSMRGCWWWEGYREGINGVTRWWYGRNKFFIYCGFVQRALVDFLKVFKGPQSRISHTSMRATIILIRLNCVCVLSDWCLTFCAQWCDVHFGSQMSIESWHKNQRH